MKIRPLGYKIQLLSVLCLLGSLCMSEFADEIGWPDEPFNLLFLVSVPASFIAGILAQSVERKYLRKVDIFISWVSLLISFCWVFFLGHLFLGDTVADLWHRKKFDA